MSDIYTNANSADYTTLNNAEIVTTKFKGIEGWGMIPTKMYDDIYNKGRGDREKELNEVIKQIMWERDLAIHQLEELGYGLGEKVEKKNNA